MDFKFTALNNIISAVHEYCLANASETNALKYARYFREGLYNGYGLTAAQIYEGAKEIPRQINITLESAMNAAPQIILQGKSEEVSIVMLIIKGMHRQFTKATFESMAGWYRYGINNWAHADTMGMMILPLFFKKNMIQVNDFSDWLVAENKYQRRSVPVTLIKVLKLDPDVEELFKFIECLMTDPEREVHQGTGWFLREAWKRQPLKTEAFLMKWKDTCPRLIIQYATEKLSKEERTRFKSVKGKQ